MRLYEIENKSPKEFAKILYTLPYIQNNSNSLSKPLYKGVRDSIAGLTYELINFEKRLKPNMTLYSIHSYLGQMIQNEFGINLREETLFCSRDRMTASMYHDSPTPYVVIPVGEYNIWYAEGVNDMTLEYNLDWGFISSKVLKFKTWFKDYLEREFHIDYSKFQLYNNMIFTSYRNFFINEGFNINDSSNFVKKFYKIIIDNINSYNKINVEHIIINLSKNDEKVIKEKLKDIFNIFAKELIDVKDDYIDKIQKTKFIADVDREEVMLECEKFYIISEEFYFDTIKEFDKGA